MITTINSSVTGITENYIYALESIESKIKDKNYVLRINSVEVPAIEIHNIIINLSNLTKSGRKKVAKRLYVYEKNGSLKSINYLFHVLNKMSVIEEKVRVDVSHREAEIQKARKQYVKLRTEAEAARIVYKELKGDFYK